MHSSSSLSTQNNDNAVLHLKTVIEIMCEKNTPNLPKKFIYITQKDDALLNDFRSIQHPLFTILNIQDASSQCTPPENEEYYFYPCRSLSEKHVVEFLNYKNSKIILSGHHRYSDLVYKHSNANKIRRILDETTTSEQAGATAKGLHFLFNCAPAVIEALPSFLHIILTPLSQPAALTMETEQKQRLFEQKEFLFSLRGKINTSLRSCLRLLNNRIFLVSKSTTLEHMLNLKSMPASLQIADPDAELCVHINPIMHQVMLYGKTSDDAMAVIKSLKLKYPYYIMGTLQGNTLTEFPPGASVRFTKEAGTQKEALTQFKDKKLAEIQLGNEPESVLKCLVDFNTAHLVFTPFTSLSTVQTIFALNAKFHFTIRRENVIPAVFNHIQQNAQKHSFVLDEHTPECITSCKTFILHNPSSLLLNELNSSLNALKNLPVIFQIHRKTDPNALKQILKQGHFQFSLHQPTTQTVDIFLNRYLKKPSTRFFFFVYSNTSDAAYRLTKSLGSKNVVYTPISTKNYDFLQRLPNDAIIRIPGTLSHDFINSLKNIKAARYLLPILSSDTDYSFLTGMPTEAPIELIDKKTLDQLQHLPANLKQLLIPKEFVMSSKEAFVNLSAFCNTHPQTKVILIEYSSMDSTLPVIFSTDSNHTSVDLSLFKLILEEPDKLDTLLKRLPLFEKIQLKVILSAIYNFLFPAAPSSSTSSSMFTPASSCPATLGKRRATSAPEEEPNTKRIKPDPDAVKIPAHLMLAFLVVHSKNYTHGGLMEFVHALSQEQIQAVVQLYQQINTSMPLPLAQMGGSELSPTVSSTRSTPTKPGGGF